MPFRKATPMPATRTNVQDEPPEDPRREVHEAVLAARWEPAPVRTWLAPLHEDRP